MLISALVTINLTVTAQDLNSNELIVEIPRLSEKTIEEISHSLTFVEDVEVVGQCYKLHHLYLRSKSGNELNSAAVQEMLLRHDFKSEEKIGTSINDALSRCEDH